MGVIGGAFFWQQSIGVDSTAGRGTTVQILPRERKSPFCQSTRQPADNWRHGQSADGARANQRGAAVIRAMVFVACEINRPLMRRVEMTFFVL